MNPSAKSELRRSRITGHTGWLLLRLAAFVAVVYAVVSFFDWRQVLASFTRLRVAYLLPVILLLTPAAVLLRSLRWRGLVPGGQQLPLGRYVRAYLVGFLANSLLPGKLGDLLKARLICQPGLEYGRSLASALADRLIEGIALLLVLLCAALGGGLPPWAYRIALWAGVASLVGLLATGYLFRQREAVSRMSARILFFFPSRLRERAARTLLHLFSGFESLTSGARVSRALAYSAGIWALEILAVVAFLTAFSIPVPRFLAAVLVLVALNFGTLLPISPGSIGVYQLLCVFALTLWQVNQDLSFSMALSMQAVLYAPVYFGGLICLLATKAKKEAGEKPLPSPALAVDKAGN